MTETGDVDQEQGLVVDRLEIEEVGVEAVLVVTEVSLAVTTEVSPELIWENHDGILVD